MSEEAWLNAEKAEELLRLLPNSFSRRKLRHFVCECVRRELHPSLGIEAASILAFAEQIADDEANVDGDDWVVTHQELYDRRGTDFAGGKAGLLLLTVGEDIWDEAHWTLEYVNEAHLDFATSLFREVFGNPFRPIDFASWRTDTAVTLARQMYESRDFGAMPILADALQDAGCDNPEVLNHCRDANQTHVRGCWVVDGVLGKE
jgi:hypothetical protein